MLSRSAILAALDRRVASGEGVLIIAIKVEGMKSFNHAHGIRMGDRLLDVIGDRILSLAGPDQHIGSLSGDVFLVLDDRRGSEWLEVIVEQATTALTRSVMLDEVEAHPRVKVGLARAEAGQADADRLVAEASAAMRVAEASRSDVVVRADKHIRQESRTEGIIDRDIERAIVANELTFAFQPLVTLHDNVVHGAEALLRWNHPEIGHVNPALLIERIEAVGLTQQFTEWSLDQLARRWASVVNGSNGLSGMSVSMNFNEDQLAHPDCATVVSNTISAHDLSPHCLVIEVVESGPVGVNDLAEATIHDLADAGHRIVLDDFGTGFNALEYFLRFPVHGLKFDRSLVSSMCANPTALVIVRGVAQIADELGVVTVAEGVETEAENDICKDLGLTFGQGWHFGRPVPLAEFVEMARASRAGVSFDALHRPDFARSTTGDPSS